MSYAFDGVNKLIILTGVTTLNLVDLYSRWKDWVLAGNASVAVAFRAVGGDIPAIPLYLFLINGWRIRPMESSHTLTVTGGILEVDGGGEPFVDPVGSFKVRINRQTPGIAIGYSSSGSTGPSAESIAAAVWQRAIEDGMTPEQMLRIMFSALAGPTAGIGTDSESYFAQDGVTPRIVASFDTANNRTSVTLDGGV